ncbi:hypothetical protein HK097_003169 [Rhizophlyctis rosea]|uniref:Uncharacterized protein n=1 Tax=Rhizophlyctis rosea TaxID=64517 RepID=A0AAD5SGJ3_9FUNG|nr:hypothetical protein HK097_003169 [Rhizophlyctis rosea]
MSGAAALESLFGNVHHLGANHPKGNFTNTQAFSLELALSFMLILVVLGTATRGKSLGPNAALAVGSMVMVNTFFGAPFGGGTMNPFRSLAPDILSREEDLNTIWIVDVVTFGQYMRPTKKHMKVSEYVHPDKFAHWQKVGEEMGFKYVASGPLVRSSYKAGGFNIKNILRAEREKQLVVE